MLQLLRMDVKALKIWLFWVWSFGCIGVGLAQGKAVLVVLGLFSFGLYVRLVLKVSSSAPRTRLLQVTLRPPFTVSAWSAEHVTAQFVDETTNTHATAICDAWAIDRFLGADGGLRALIAYDPQAKFNPAIGIRPPEV